MDDIKLYASNQVQMNHLMDVTGTFSKDIHMEFRIDKCKVLNIKKGKTIDEGAALPSGLIGHVMEDGETYRYLGFQQARQLETKQAKIKIKDQYFKCIKAILKSKLDAGNLITAIHTYAVSVLTYSFGIINWSDTDLDDIQRTTQTMMTKYNSLHSIM